MIKWIYFTGLISGLLFPVIDDLLNRYSKIYRLSEDESRRWNHIEIYRKGPFHYKLIAALIPVLNLMWFVAIVLMIRMYVVWWLVDIRYRALKRLAREPHKDFILKVRIVKKFFRSDLDLFYRLCEDAILIRKGYTKEISSLLRMIEKAAVEEPPKDKEDDKEQGKN